MMLNQQRFVVITIFLALNAAFNAQATSPENPLESEVSEHDVSKTTIAPEHRSSGFVSTLAPGSSRSGAIPTLVDGLTSAAEPHHNISSSPAPAVAASKDDLLEISNGPSKSLDSTIKESVISSQKEESLIPKFCDYLKPICESVDKIQPKQLFKIQTQFKQFVQLSTGELGMCFLDHYAFEPGLKPITQENLKTICSSKKLAPELSGSYKSFQNCAVKAWGAPIDKELDKIALARAKCMKNHLHALNNSLAILDHDDEDFSLISDVVNSVLESDKNPGNSLNSGVRVIDLSGTTHKPGSHNSNLDSTAAPSLMSDPNTMVVFVDTATSTTAPSMSKSESLEHSKLLTTLKPILRESIIASTAAPHGNFKSIPTPSLHSMISHSVTTSVPLLSHSGIESTSKPTIGKEGSLSSSILTTSKPLAGLLTSKKTELIAKVTTKSPSIEHPAPSVKPEQDLQKTIEGYEEILKRQEKEKQELELKLKIEREKYMKQLQKKQDEIDAHVAVKALQHQRDSAPVHSDVRLHQLEHERQMSIDPIGHTLKHQQYELSRQQKMFAVDDFKLSELAKRKTSGINDAKLEKRSSDIPLGTKN